VICTGSACLQWPVEPGDVAIFEPRCCQRLSIICSRTKNIPVQCLSRDCAELVLVLHPRPPRSVLKSRSIVEVSTPRHNQLPGRPNILLTPIVREVVDVPRWLRAQGTIVLSPVLQDGAARPRYCAGIVFLVACPILRVGILRAGRRFLGTRM
jgi:hypothetical protein